MGMDEKQQKREAHILDMAAHLITHHGYDKTTLGDIAEAAGISRGVLYLHFANKEKLVEALINREILLYSRIWSERQDADPNGGTIAAMYRNALFAINSRPLMAALMRRDRHIFGSYLRKPNNISEVYQSRSPWTETLHKLQEVGAVRQDIKPDVLAAILDMLSYGLVSVDEIRQPEEIPPFDDLMEAIAALMDRALAPKEGGNLEAGKAIIHDFATAALSQFERTQFTRAQLEEKDMAEKQTANEARQPQ
jgi:AcrR family transcriptional regulator